MLKKIIIKNIEDLKKHIKTRKPSLYTSSQTSTVIPYHKINKLLKINKEENYYICDLSQLPKKLKLKNNELTVSGAVSWKEANSFLKEKGKSLKTYPTEELALINAGLATSCTGERCFSYGTLRDQVINCKYIDYKGNEIFLTRNKNLQLKSNKYHSEYQKYNNLKNAPFPRLEKEVDLMIGTEGQLGVITESTIEVIDNERTIHLFILVPRWEFNIESHLEIVNKIQKYKKKVITCEMIDSNSFSYLKKEEQPNKEMDAIFLEIKEQFFEEFYNDFVLELKTINQNNVFEISNTKFHQLRAKIPRSIHEQNSNLNIIKKGTDIQVHLKDFKYLLEQYQSFSKKGIKYNLFGHFGDCHLHFNFMPKENQTNKSDKLLIELYKKIIKLNASPFAEHGIGLIKQQFLLDFLNEDIIDTFKEMKNKHDPYNQFFPQGFMSLKK